MQIWAPGLLTGKSAIVTGAGRGLGAAIARGLASHGAAVTLCDINEESVQSVAAGIVDAGGRAIAQRTDVSDLADCRAAAAAGSDAFGPISILVNNAGVQFADAVGSDAFVEGWDRTFAVNVTGMRNMTLACLDDLRETAGAVVNIGSIRSHTVSPNSAAYSAAKGAVLQFTRAMAAELAPDGVRVNGLAPGLIETGMSARTRGDADRLTAFLNHVPMARAGAPEELVGPVVFLASEMSSYVTGGMLPVDGGYLVI